MSYLASSARSCSDGGERGGRAAGAAGRAAARSAGSCGGHAAVVRRAAATVALPMTGAFYSLYEPAGLVGAAHVRTPRIA